MKITRTFLYAGMIVVGLSSAVVSSVIEASICIDEYGRAFEDARCRYHGQSWREAEQDSVAFDRRDRTGHGYENHMGQSGYHEEERGSYHERVVHQQKGYYRGIGSPKACHPALQCE